MSDATKITALTAIDLASYEPVRAVECGHMVELEPGEILISSRAFADEAEVTHKAFRLAETALSGSGFWSVRIAVPEHHLSRKVYTLLEWRRFIHPGRAFSEPANGGVGTRPGTRWGTSEKPMDTVADDTPQHKTGHKMGHKPTTPPRDSHATELYRAPENISLVGCLNTAHAQARTLAEPTNLASPVEDEHTRPDPELERRMTEVMRKRNGGSGHGR